MSSSSIICKSDFLHQFESIAPLKIRSEQELRGEIKKIKETLANSEEDWKKRIEALKRVQGLVKGSEDCGAGRAGFLSALSQLNYILPAVVRDLRSQIVKEAAITTSLILQKFGSEMQTLAEDVLMAAMSQVPVTTKIMSSSAIILSEFVVENCQTRQIFNILATFSTSKDKVQRRQLAYLLGVILRTWANSKHVPRRQLCDLVRLAICDADPETRQNGRKCFGLLGETPEADEIFRDVDRSHQKLLRPDEVVMSRSVSVTSVKSEPRKKSTDRMSVSSTTLRSMTPVLHASTTSVVNQKPIQISKRRTASVEAPKTLQDILKLCQNSSGKERGIELLDKYLVSHELSRIEINNIGSVLNRLLDSIQNPTLFDVFTYFILKYHQVLPADWLKLTLGNIFMRKIGADSRVLRNLNSSIEVIIETFNGDFQLGIVCEMIYEPLRPMIGKVKIVLLCYFNDLVTSRGDSLNLQSPQVLRAIQKLSEWMKSSPELEKHVRRIFVILEEEPEELPNPIDILVSQNSPESLSTLLDLISIGNFEPGEKTYAKLLLNIFKTIENSGCVEEERLLALRVLTKLCTLQASKLFYSSEIVVCKVLDFAADSSKDNGRNQDTIDECLKVLATHLPRQKILNITKIFLKNRANVDRVNAVIRMISKMVEDVRIDEISQIMDEIMGSVVRAYGSKSSLIRRNVIFCIVTMVNRTGEDVMKEYLEKLPKSMQTLIQIYVNRTISASLGNCAPPPK